MLILLQGYPLCGACCRRRNKETTTRDYYICVGVDKKNTRDSVDIQLPITHKLLSSSRAPSPNTDSRGLAI